MRGPIKGVHGEANKSPRPAPRREQHSPKRKSPALNERTSPVGSTSGDRRPSNFSRISPNELGSFFNNNWRNPRRSSPARGGSTRLESFQHTNYNQIRSSDKATLYRGPRVTPRASKSHTRSVRPTHTRDHDEEDNSPEEHEDEFQRQPRSRSGPKHICNSEHLVTLSELNALLGSHAILDCPDCIAAHQRFQSTVSVSSTAVNSPRGSVRGDLGHRQYPHQDREHRRSHILQSSGGSDKPGRLRAPVVTTSTVQPAAAVQAPAQPISMLEHIIENADVADLERIEARVQQKLKQAQPKNVSGKEWHNHVTSCEAGNCTCVGFRGRSGLCQLCNHDLYLHSDQEATEKRRFLDKRCIGLVDSSVLNANDVEEELGNWGTGKSNRVEDKWNRCPAPAPDAEQYYPAEQLNNIPGKDATLPKDATPVREAPTRDDDEHPRVAMSPNQKKFTAKPPDAFVLQPGRQKARLDPHALQHLQEQMRDDPTAELFVSIQSPRSAFSTPSRRSSVSSTVSAPSSSALSQPSSALSTALSAYAHYR